MAPESHGREVLIEKIAQAIARMEGFYKPGTRAQRNNNPGNLRKWGKQPTEGGYVKFPAPVDGWRALRRQIKKNIERKLTLYEFFGGKPGVYSGYAPASDKNDPKHYAEFVAQRAGIRPDVPLSEVAS